MGAPVKKVTIAAIAAAAGVSAPTVSRVLNGRGEVAAGTRERIERLLREQDYRPRASRRTERVGLIDLVFDVIDCPWETQLIRGVEDAAHDAGVGTVITTIRSGRSAWAAGLRARPTDGVIMACPSRRGPVVAELRRAGVPAVLIDPPGGVAAEVPTVTATNWEGARSATAHLIALGHTRIGFVEGHRSLLCSRARGDGYRAALEEAGLALDRSLVEPGDFGYASGVSAGRRLLDRADPPTAIFAGSDHMALGIYAAAWELGKAVPGDLSVVGFDDLPESRWSAPPLTTVRQPLVEMGRLAARTLLRLIDDEPVESPRMELPTELLVRGSTAPPAI